MELQEKLAASRLLSEDELSAIPDRLFAFVGRAPNGDVLRKYAMHDAPHVMTSIVYFLECHDSLPEIARAKVAERLVNSCAWYDEGIEPPPDLVKLALLSKEARHETIVNPPANWDPVEAAKNAPMLGREYFPGAMVTEKGKKADLRGSASLSTQGTLSADPRSPSPERKGLAQKTANAGCNYALPSKKKYPINTPEEVKTAAQYFEKHAGDFSPQDRTNFARNVTGVAAAMGVKVASRSLERWGRTEYGDFIADELQRRVSTLEGHAVQQGFELLLEKRASTPPDVMFEMLQRLDSEVGFDRVYGRPAVGFREPYEAVFGKFASAPVSFAWNHEGHSTTGPELELYAKMHPRLDLAFGPGFDMRFASDPVAAFSSLRTEQKMVLCRLANEASRTP